MIIVKANPNDLDGILKITEETRAYFKGEGIPQWQNAYPNKETFENDIKLERLFVVKEEEKVIGFFALVYPDHNYDYIEDGKWEDNSPYIAIHRMAIDKDYKGRGFAGKVFDYVKEEYDHIRIDTHKLNNSMIRAIIKNDFVYRGVIYVEDGTPRNAYEWSRKWPKIIGDFSNRNFSSDVASL